MCNNRANKKGAHSFSDKNLSSLGSSMQKMQDQKSLPRFKGVQTVRKRETRKTVRTRTFETVEKTVSSGQNVCTQSER